MLALGQTLEIDTGLQGVYTGSGRRVDLYPRDLWIVHGIAGSEGGLSVVLRSPETTPGEWSSFLAFLPHGAATGALGASIDASEVCLHVGAVTRAFRARILPS
jgi:hypothetical protein